MLRRALRAVAVDAALLRRRRELRLLMIGQGVSLLGTAVTLVAIPVQMYDLTLFAWSGQPARNVDRPSGAPAARWQAPGASGGCLMRG